MIWNLEKEIWKEESIPVTVNVKELAGGHSGINIGKGLGNSIVLLGRLCYALRNTQARVSAVSYTHLNLCLLQESYIMLQ